MEAIIDFIIFFSLFSLIGVLGFYIIALLFGFFSAEECGPKPINICPIDYTMPSCSTMVNFSDKDIEEIANKFPDRVPIGMPIFWLPETDDNLPKVEFTGINEEDNYLIDF